MKRYNSLKRQLLFYITLSFVFLGFSISIVSYIHLLNIIDIDKNLVYNEKINLILSQLELSNIKLDRTGMVEVYKKDFQDRFVNEFLASYKDEYQSDTYPFIINLKGDIIAHPNAELILTPESIIPHNVEVTKSYIHRDILGFNNAIIINYFKDWDWYIGYSTPLKEKYSSITRFFRVLIPIIFLIYLFVFSVIYYVIKINFKPILDLSHASAEIAKGHLNYTLNVYNTNEVGALAENFRLMQKSINDKIELLTESNLEISEREHQLKSVRQYLKNVINSIPSILVCVDKNCKITMYNDAAKEEIVEEGIEGLFVSDVFIRLKPYVYLLKNTIEQRKINKHESPLSYEVVGEKRYEEVAFYPLFGEDIQGVVIRIDDITQKVMLQNKIIQSDKIMSLGGIAAGMAHEINNPLAGIMQSHEVIVRRLTLSSPLNLKTADETNLSFNSLQDYLEKRKILQLLNNTRESVLRASSIVKNMLGFARESKNKVQLSNISELLNKTIQLSTTEYDINKKIDFKAINIIKEFDENIPTIHCEPSKIQQVILNLLKNAAEELLYNGTVSDSQPQIIIRAFNLKDNICIEVEDNGKGIPEEVINKIFNPFFSTKPQGRGTGIGLSLSYFIITNNLHGEMDVTSSNERGAKFTIKIPVSK